MPLPQFRSRVVQSFEAVQQNFDQLRGLLLGNFLRLAVAVASGRAVAFGTGTIDWPGGSVTSSTLTVTHGLVDSAGAAVAPVGVWIQVGLSSNHMTTRWPSATATQFTVSARTTDGVSPPITQHDPIVWLAIG